MKTRHTMSKEKANRYAMLNYGLSNAPRHGKKLTQEDIEMAYFIGYTQGSNDTVDKLLEKVKDFVLEDEQ